MPLPNVARLLPVAATLRHRARRVCRLITCVWLAWHSCASAASDTGATPRKAVTLPATNAGFADSNDDMTMAADVARLAREAYVWGWPLAYVHQCRLALDRVPVPGRSGGMPVAPVNRLAMLTDRVAPRTAIVPCPNQDVIYGFGIFDLMATPVVLQVPDFGDRYWLYQLGDQRTDGFATLGSMYGTRPGCYLVVGPGWNGTAPPGIEGVLRCPTRHAYCLPRVFFRAADGDRAAALPAVNRIVAYPFAEFDGGVREVDWSKARWLPNIARRSAEVSPRFFFEILPRLLDDVPPLPGEERLYGDLRRLVAVLDRNPALAGVAVEAAGQAERDVVTPLFQFRNVGRPLAGNWTTIDNGAAFGTDYVTRTAVARSNVFVNRQRETKYYFLDLDARGERLCGRRTYQITFPAGALPPARAFWSLTVYDDQHALPPNHAGTFAIGSRDGSMQPNADGSLTITVSPGPTGDAGMNRLTAPDGDFSLYLRLYWPLDQAIDGTWTPPPVEPDPAPLERATREPQSAEKPLAIWSGSGTIQFLATPLKCENFAGCGEAAVACFGSEKHVLALLTGQLGGTPWVSAGTRTEQEALHVGLR